MQVQPDSFFVSTGLCYNNPTKAESPHNLNNHWFTGGTKKPGEPSRDCTDSSRFYLSNFDQLQLPVSKFTVRLNKLSQNKKPTVSESIIWAWKLIIFLFCPFHIHIEGNFQRIPVFGKLKIALVFPTIYHEKMLILLDLLCCMDCIFSLIVWKHKTRVNI